MCCSPRFHQGRSQQGYFRHRFWFAHGKESKQEPVAPPERDFSPSQTVSAAASQAQEAEHGGSSRPSPGDSLPCVGTKPSRAPAGLPTAANTSHHPPPSYGGTKSHSAPAGSQESCPLRTTRCYFPSPLSPLRRPQAAGSGTGARRARLKRSRYLWPHSGLAFFWISII